MLFSGLSSPLTGDILGLMVCNVNV